LTRTVKSNFKFGQNGQIKWHFDGQIKPNHRAREDHDSDARRDAARAIQVILLEGFNLKTLKSTKQHVL